MKIVVCGSRNLDNSWAPTIRARLKQLPSNAIIIEGGAPGADTLAHHAAESLNLEIHTVRADWKKFGRSAGPLRNRIMLDMQPHLVIAFHPDINASRGTKHCVTEAKRRNIPVEIITTCERSDTGNKSISSK